MSRKPTRQTQGDPLLLPSARKAQGGQRVESTSPRGQSGSQRRGAAHAAENPNAPELTARASGANLRASETSVPPTGAHAQSKAAGRGEAATAGDGPAAHTQHTQTAVTKDLSEDFSTAKALPLGAGVRLVSFHPCGLYVLDKPEGVLSHPNKKTEIRRSLLQAPYSMQEECSYDLQPASPAQPASTQAVTQATEQTLTKEQSGQKLYLLHRLDSATSGLLLLADNLALAQAVREAFASGAVRKTYLALCASDGRLRAGDKGRWSERLQRQHSGGGASTLHVHAGQGQSAVTDYVCKKVEARSRSLALLELHPLSGRTHQLRVHCAGHGLPIIGDTKYGDFRLNRSIAQASGHKRLFLHAAALSLNLSLGQGRQSIRLALESPLPPAFEELLRAGTAFTKSMPTPRSGRPIRRS